MPLQRGVEVVLAVGLGVEDPRWIAVAEGEVAARLEVGAGTCEELQGEVDQHRMVSGAQAFHQECHHFHQETCCPFPAAIDSCLGPEDAVAASEKEQEVVGIAPEEEVAVAAMARVAEGGPMAQVVQDEKDLQKGQTTCSEEAASPYLDQEGGAFAAALDFVDID